MKWFRRNWPYILAGIIGSVIGQVILLTMKGK
jgi:hypothetical protein